MGIISKPWKLYNAAKKAFTGGAQKTTGTGAINTTNISKNLKEFQKHKEDIIKSTNKYGKGLSEEGKIQIKKAVAPALSKLSQITQKKPKFNKGGRVGLKGGSDLKAVIDKKTNKKIFVTKEELAKNTNKYNPPSMVEKRAKGGRVGLKGGTNLGMQSVKYGLDNKPEVTKLDRIAKFIAKDKKKKNKKFKTPMDQAVKKDKKNKRFV